MTIQRIIEQTAATFGVSARDLIGDARTKHIAAARQAAYLLARELLPWASCTDIARVFGRDHSTVLHGIEVAQHRGREQPTYQRAVLNAKAALEGGV